MKKKTDKINKAIKSQISYARIVDRLGIIQREAQALAAEDEFLRKTLKLHFKSGAIVSGLELFNAVIHERENRVANIKKLHNDLPAADFFHVATVSLEKLSDVLSENEIKRYVKVVEPTKVIYVRPKSMSNKGATK